jgi:hypothetical protein
MSATYSSRRFFSRFVLGLTVGKFPHLFVLRQRQHPLPPVPVEVAPFYAVRTIESKKVQRGRTFGRLRIEVAAIRRQVLS